MTADRLALIASSPMGGLIDVIQINYHTWDLMYATEQQAYGGLMMCDGLWQDGHQLLAYYRLAGK